MLTPRRTLLLLAGFVLFGVAYFIYTRALGWLDGLPQLPEHMLTPSPGDFVPPLRTTSPTQQKLAQAFGDNSPEMEYAFYPTQLEFRQGDSSIVLAAGRPPNNPNSKRVALTPFSLAIFAKPKPPHLRAAGEVTEISTLHADKGILEFDRVINSPSDMNKAKLVRLELVSDPEQALPDPRRGTVHITNNQRSADPNKFLVLRTPGPVFYRDAKVVAGTPAAQGPDFWTDAAVEIVDRQNLPRPFDSGALATAPSKGEDTRTPAAVSEILSGERLPPPTVTAIGLRVYLEPDPPQGKKKPQRPGSAGISNVRRIELLEQVLLNLWVDNGQSLVGGAPAEAPKSGNSLALTPPPSSITAVTGGLGPGAYTARLMNRALLQIDTRGPFAYDAEKNLARFDVVPHSDPKLPNDVQVTKVPATSGTSSLFSQVLEIEFNGGLAGSSRPPGTPAIKKLHAWTSTPGRFLTLAAQDEAMEAYGQDLVHDQAASRTILTGAPLYVIRERNVLSAGAPQRPATLTSEPAPALAASGGLRPPLAKPEQRKLQATVRGAGRIELFDSTSNSNTITASWLTSLVQTKEIINGREQDLFTFTDGAEFKDVKADYWLKGNVLKLWLEPRPEAKLPETKTASQSAKPARIQALGQVSSHSTDYDIERADQLNVWFEDAKTPAVAAVTPPVSPSAPPSSVAVAPSGPLPPVIAPKPPDALPPVPKEPEKPKPPTKIQAKTIDTWVTRVPVKPDEKKPPPKLPESGKPEEQPAAFKYQLDRARCEENVIVHQDPIDPTKPRGTDIFGRLLLLDGSADGSKLTVFGWPDKLGEVHQERMSLIGPEVILDQVHNKAEVKGRGALTMPSNSDFSGTELAQPEVVIIHWRDSMSFNGAMRSAEFNGKVFAKQGESSILCHTMSVQFDRPMYFNPAQKKAAEKPVDPKDPTAKKKESAKIDKVFCYSAPADAIDDKRELLVTYAQVERDKTGKLIKSQLLWAQELKLFAQFQDAGGGEKYQLVVADGPGELRVLQEGDKDFAGPPANNKPPRPIGPVQPGAKPAPPIAEQEMKLTIVKFNSSMTAIDKGKVFQKATFEKNVQVINVPANDQNLQVERHKLPPRAVLLTCTRELVVWSHKKGNAPPVQHMNAIGNAYLRSDDYDGWGDKISNDGKLVILTGSDRTPARIMNRFNQGNDQSGKVIRYDRSTGAYDVVESFGGTISSPPKK
ncbi:MAG: hypothetical protein L0241_24545 [Planctomycetia bacterium]|nr:hypothetical protein [Planctomycetia bacterium]